MSAVVTSFARRIAQAHEAATGSWRDAVLHAVRAGELLTEVKAALPHGAFGDFCAALPFGETTARGYMRLARLDPANRQRVADMPLRAALLEIAEPRLIEPESPSIPPELSWPTVTWTPTQGHWHIAVTDDAVYHVVPSLKFPDNFLVSKLYEVGPDDSRVDATKWPVREQFVEGTLQHMGLREPWSVEWRLSRGPGHSAAFGMPESARDCGWVP